MIKDGEQTLLSDFWGCCEGNHTYIKINDNFFELFRDNNTYSFWSYDHPIFIPHSSRMPIISLDRGVLFNYGRQELFSKDYLIFWRPMELDMETGKAF